MNIHMESQGNIVVAHPVGRVDSGSAPAFEHALISAIENGAYRLVVDFASIDYISSAGLRSLLVAGKKVRSLPAGKMVICSLQEQIRDVFEISGFLSVFSISDDLDGALAYFPQ